MGRFHTDCPLKSLTCNMLRCILKLIDLHRIIVQYQNLPAIGIIGHSSQGDAKYLRYSPDSGLLIFGPLLYFLTVLLNSSSSRYFLFYLLVE